jgi:hypothetical protein
MLQKPCYTGLLTQKARILLFLTSPFHLIRLGYVPQVLVTVVRLLVGYTMAGCCLGLCLPKRGSIAQEW